MQVLALPMSAPADADDAHHAQGEPAPALVARAAHGDAEASRALWDHYAPPVRRFVRRMLGPDGDPGDVLQEIFLGVFVGLPRLRQPEAIRSFVFAVAANQVRLEIRRRRWRTLFRRSDDQSTTAGASVGADQDSLIAARHLYIALGKLSLRDRELVVLRFLEGMTLPEVAAQSGCSLATVKRRLDRASSALFVLAGKDAFLRGYLGQEAGGGHG
jgi:RNA polymerase sigma-70 factor (ECF subfamily)